jgi:hypothetical protein
VIILNANPNADALHPDAIYRVNIDNDGDYLTDIAFSYSYRHRYDVVANRTPLLAQSGHPDATDSMSAFGGKTDIRRRHLNVCF